MFLKLQHLWIQTPATKSHFPFAKSKGFRTFLKDWRYLLVLGTGEAVEKKMNA
tara:strand:- start:28 stop:186 length:159 start_codon:yes stop_codon:yes gene_type:complete